MLGLGFVALFTRVFSARDFGRYGLVASIVTLATAVASQWLQQGATRFLPGAAGGTLAETLGATALGLLGSAVAALVFGALVALPVVRMTGSSWAPFAPAAVAAVVLLVLFNGTCAVLQARMHASRYRVYRVLDAAARFGFAGGLVFVLARRAEMLLWAQVLSGLALVPFVWRDAALPGIRAVARAWRSHAARLRALAAYGVPMVGWYLAAVLLEVGDRYIIEFFRGSREVGIYSANYGLVNGAVGLLAAPILLAAHPFLMRAWERGNRPVAMQWLGAIAEWFAIAGLVLTAGLWIFARDVARLLLGPEFREGYRVMPLALGGLVAWQLGMYTHKPLEFAGATRTMLAASLVAAAANVGLNVVLVPHYGYLAAAYTTLACYAGYTVLTFALGRRLLRWAPDWRWLTSRAALAISVFWGASWVAVVLRARIGPWAALTLKGVVVLIMAAVVLRWLPGRLPSGTTVVSATQPVPQP